MNTDAIILKKSSGKCAPIRIDHTVQQRVKNFSSRLFEMAVNGELTPDQIKAVDAILYKLDAYDSNLIIAYFDYDQSPSTIAKMMGTTSAVIVAKIKKIQERINDIITSPDYTIDDRLRNRLDGSEGVNLQTDLQDTD